MFPWQQPLAQLLAPHVGATHAPLWQTEVPQFTHALPLVPQALAVVAVTHVVPWQQPFGQVLGEQPGI